MFVTTKIQSEIGYVLSKIDKNKREGIVSYLEGGVGKYGGTVASNCRKFESMSEDGINEFFCI